MCFIKTKYLDKLLVGEKGRIIRLNLDNDNVLERLYIIGLKKDTIVSVLGKDDSSINIGYNDYSIKLRLGVIKEILVEVLNNG